MNTKLKHYLCPPGNGVFTVSTGKDKKESLQYKIYQTLDINKINHLFKKKLSGLKNLAPQQTALLGICSDTGGGILRGANWGPLFIREKLYQTKTVEKIVDVGDIKIIPHLLHDKYLNQKTIKRCQKALYGEENDLAVSPLSIAEDCINTFYQTIANFRLLALGGDHSVSYPLVKSYLRHKKQNNINVGLIHFDAHTDLLHERLGIDLCFGSWLTHVLPYINHPSQVIQLGLRASNKDKTHWQKMFGIQQFWAKEIKNQGINAIIEKAIESLKSQRVDEIYISFDIDALDSTIASATGTPEPNGLSLDESLQAINQFSHQFKLTGADLVEVAPLVRGADENSSEKTLDAATKIAMALIEGLT